jgi:hypothetical protein
MSSVAWAQGLLRIGGTCSVSQPKISDGFIAAELKVFDQQVDEQSKQGD